MTSYISKPTTGIFILITLLLCLVSFKATLVIEETFRQIGLDKNAADKKITSSILGGFFNSYDVSKAKNIAAGNRTAIVKDLLVYTRKHTASENFIKEYQELKLKNKPEEGKLQTPEEMRASTIKIYQESIAQTEESLKKADANSKPIFEEVLASAKKELKNAEDPNNKQFASYAKGYPDMMKAVKAGYDQQLKLWEEEYPANPQLFVKKRLQQFMDGTKDIDFGAELKTQNGKKIFVNPAYESKGNYWKMAFRAGPETVEPARSFISNWIAEIK